MLQTAVKLAYRHGFRTTSLADIAEAAKVPVGNVYYYFKTKDEIGEAIVEQRLLEFRTLQEQWNQKGSPKERLLACIENTFENRDLLARGGCPVGTLCSELHKGGRASSEEGYGALHGAAGVDRGSISGDWTGRHLTKACYPTFFFIAGSIGPGSRVW